MNTYTPFHVSIANVSGSLYEGNVRLLSVPSTTGILTILAHHEPCILLIQEGVIHIVPADDSDEVALNVQTGVLEIHDNTAIVLV